MYSSSIISGGWWSRRGGWGGVGGGFCSSKGNVIGRTNLAREGVIERRPS